MAWFIRIEFTCKATIKRGQNKIKILFFRVLPFEKCLTDDGLCPNRDVVRVALEEVTIGHAKEQAGLNVFHRVVVNIYAVDQGNTTLAINYRFLIAGNNFGNGNIVTSLHYTLSNTRGVDGRMIRGHKEQDDGRWYSYQNAAADCFISSKKRAVASEFV